MDKTLESFLHPKRHPNIKFKLRAFPEQFEMRELTVDETASIDKEASEKGWAGTDSLMHYAAEALTIPNLRNKELQDALSEKCGKKIMEPYNAFREMFTGPEAKQIVGKYIELANLGINVQEKIEEAKNA